MAWKKGISWTKGGWFLIHNPDGTCERLYISSGLFIWIKFLGIEFYFGMRPTPPWGEGFGNEGIFPSISRWMKRHGFGNFGFALRRKS